MIDRKPGEVVLHKGREHVVTGGYGNRAMIKPLAPMPHEQSGAYTHEKSVPSHTLVGTGKTCAG